ncbi:MAG: hypothetical protein M1399_07295 [Actinobacteria bacterium]|nr:hypothetical protein [Actinomycetota bacterium]MCL5446666.1 hypothetical protein [Actinomycetota bacterium]
MSTTRSLTEAQYGPAEGLEPGGDGGPPTGGLAGAATDFRIVPLKGIPVAAAILVGLIVAIATNKLWALDFFHVVGGGLWTATDLFIGLFIGPMVLARLSIPARIEFSKRFMPKMIIIMPVLVTMTLAGGFQLALKSHFLSPAMPEHGWLIAAFCVVGVMLVVAMGTLGPANLAILFELKKPQPDGEIIGKLMGRFVWGAAILGVMQVATLIIMTRVATL